MEIDTLALDRCIILMIINKYRHGMKRPVGRNDTIQNLQRKPSSVMTVFFICFYK